VRAGGTYTIQRVLRGKTSLMIIQNSFSGTDLLTANDEFYVVLEVEHFGK
jgi:hypothetical protein